MGRKESLSGPTTEESSLTASNQPRPANLVSLAGLLLAATLCGRVAELGAQEEGSQEPIKGRVVEPLPFASQVLGEERIVRIYFPPGYDQDHEARFPVLYVHDGQNVLSTAGPAVAFGWGGWDVDRTAERLAAEGRMREIMVVAVDNSPRRMREYRGPRRPQEILPDSASPEPTPFHLYMRFLVEELKPWVDQLYRTLPGPSDTGVMGSSLGGICSLALAWERPDIFGGAASLSGSFQMEGRWFLEGSPQVPPGPSQTHPGLPG